MSKAHGPSHPGQGDGGHGSHGDRPEAEPFVRLSAVAPRDGAAVRVSSYQERTGALIRRAAIPEGMDARRLDRLWNRLAHRRRPRTVLRGGVPLRWAVAAVLLLSAGAVAAKTGVWTWPRTMVQRFMGEPAHKANPSTAMSGADERKRRGSSRASALAAVPLPDLPPAVASEAAPAAPPPPVFSPPHTVGRRDSGPSRALPPAAHPAPAPRDAQLSEESRSLGRALVQLRQDRDPAGALAELDRYAVRFPAGILEREALVARVDALLMAERPTEAQAILSRLTLGSNGRDRELRLIRAELATSSSCAAALDDYQAVWAAHPEGTLGERAMWGQAVCHARLGDQPRAHADLKRYLAQFPDGPHATDAHARLLK